MARAGPRRSRRSRLPPCRSPRRHAVELAPTSRRARAVGPRRSTALAAALVTSDVVHMRSPGRDRLGAIGSPVRSPVPRQTVAPIPASAARRERLRHVEATNAVVEAIARIASREHGPERGRGKGPTALSDRPSTPWRLAVETLRPSTPRALERLRATATASRGTSLDNLGTVVSEPRSVARSTAPRIRRRVSLLFVHAPYAIMSVVRSRCGRITSHMAAVSEMRRHAALLDTAAPSCRDAGR